MDVRCIALIVGTTTMTLNLAAAPFVPGAPRSLSRQIEAGRAAVLVSHAESSTGWTVDAILKDATGAVKLGAVLQPKPAPPAGTTSALLISNLDRSITVLPLTAAAKSYVGTLPKADALAAEKLRFAAQHVADPDPTIAEDGFALLAEFSFEELQQHRDLLPADRLRHALAADETPVHHLGLYGGLLGLCGTKADAGLIYRRLLALDGFCLGADGLAAGYVMLAGEQGLSELETLILSAKEPSPLQAAAVLDALTFFRSEMTERLSTERLRRTTCRLMERHEFADLVIGHLAGVRDWEAMPQVLALLQSEDSDPTRKRAVEVTVTRYLLECRRDADTTPLVRKQADVFLTHLESADPDLIRRATRLSGIPPERH